MQPPAASSCAFHTSPGCHNPRADACAADASPLPRHPAAADGAGTADVASGAGTQHPEATVADAVCTAESGQEERHANRGGPTGE